MTWYLGLPSSSSHALIGGVVGSAIAARARRHPVDGIWDKVLRRAPVADRRLRGRLRADDPDRLGHRRRSPSQGEPRLPAAQIVSGGFVAFTHGTNDAQKTMGIIALALIASGHLSPDFSRPPIWVIVSSALAMAAGTYVGGWRIIRTLGHADREDRPAAGIRRADGMRQDPLDDRALSGSRSRRRMTSRAP